MKFKITIIAGISAALYSLIIGFPLASAQVLPVQHLDATLTESVITTDGSDSVKQWNDQSGNNNHALLNAGGVFYPSSSLSATGKAGLDFGGQNNLMELFSSAESDSILDFSAAASGNTGFAILIAFKADSVLAGDWNDLIGNSSTALDKLHLGIRYRKDGTFQIYLGSASIQAGVLNAGETVVFAVNYTKSSGTLEFWNSNDNSIRIANTAASDFSNDNPILLGGLRTPTEGRYFNGMVGEVKIFTSSLLTDELLSEGQDMKFKWAIDDYETDPPVPNPATFSLPPASISGTVIIMTASTGSDVHEPVEYLFTETSGNPGASSSGWQKNPTFRDGDLQPLTEYSYTVCMRDAYGNIGDTSASVTATTGADSIPGQFNDLEYGAYYGYQGWHFAPGDGRTESNNWVHWFNNNTPDEDNVHGDMWPDLREYEPEKLYETDLKFFNGETAKVYSSHDYSTIDLHIKWMKDYGIKGCVVQRFTNSIDKAAQLEQGDKKILDVMTACEKYGIKFWVMHDAGGGDAGEYERITGDWKHLVDDLHILQSPAYTYQDGKPVYGLWGMGISSRSWTPATVSNILDFFQEGDSTYRAYVLGGIPTNWFYNRPEGWTVVYDRLDMISPWRTIFYRNAAYEQEDIDRMYAEKSYCDERGIDYNPVIAPGASSGNIGLATDSPNRRRNSVPRNGGYYIWQQAYEVCKMSKKFMYIAMYDEVDEGTAMYKLGETEDDIPIDSRQLSLDEEGYDLPSDWYLQLGREIQKMMDGSIPLSEKMPLTPTRLFELSPTPSNGSTGVSNIPLLGWNPASIAHSYNVYLTKGLPVFSEANLVSSQSETSFEVSSPLEGNGLYYWKVDVLTQTQTFSGETWSFTVEEPTQIKDVTSNSIKIYPVPAQNELQVSGLNSVEVPCSVYNVLGKKLLEDVLQNTNSLDISELDRGIYLLHIEGHTPARFVKE